MKPVSVKTGFETNRFRPVVFGNRFGYRFPVWFAALLRISNNTWMDISFSEGKSRIVRKMFDAIGHPVSKLQRVSYATIGLGKLDPKRYRVLRGDEVERIKAVADGTPIDKIKKQKKYKKGYALPKIKKSPLRKKKRR